MSGVTTHVLDTSLGCPAAGVAIRLERQDRSGQWILIGEGATDSDGRLKTLLGDRSAEKGIYRLTFDVKSYFQSSERKSSPAT